MTPKPHQKKKKTPKKQTKKLTKNNKNLKHHILEVRWDNAALAAAVAQVRYQVLSYDRQTLTSPDISVCLLPWQLIGYDFDSDVDPLVPPQRINQVTNKYFNLASGKESVLLATHFRGDTLGYGITENNT